MRRRDPVRVLHLAGSAMDPALAELSLLYARGAIGTLGGLQGYEHLLAVVDPGGLWRFPLSLAPEAVAAAPALDVAEAVDRIAYLAPHVALPQMFCRLGMTRYRSLLELMEIPLVGNGPEAMAFGADKARARALVAAAGVAVPVGRLVRDGSGFPWPGHPVVVKPREADNSAGVSLVRAAQELPGAVAAACRESARGEALVERYIELGREVRCGVLERHGELVVLPLEEYAVSQESKPIRDAADKLRRGFGGGLELVAKDPEHAWIVAADDPIVPAVRDAARRCHRALGCRHYSLFDFRIDPHGNPWFLEASLYCSFSPQSVLAVMAAAAGTPVTELFVEMVDLALEREERDEADAA